MPIPQTTPAAAGTTVATGTVVTVTDATFAEVVLASPVPVLVDFWAVWCPPCRMMHPILEKLAADYAGRLTVASLNCDEEPGTALTYGILAMPTFKVFRGGEQVASVVGARSGAALRKIVDDLL
ncbi:thioredoxin [Frankia sp. CNm7]|uniref:Thioredoxin n=2 Tax=Frankia nepalensis TaxID=1836974 RepID=A0A937RQ71_9ACTN|nr:thioredoxin [Frankia nepalensis]MBL7501731.1 thioredoxin [Frankia nepalensis]MBL7514349.1 thioredoxin [Frankia nepalensis]MBL7517892.1 thioredoxin [Frankia nepalensis]MBL7631374.1 thioredoxin [Frankia nepalensis]